MSTKTFLPIVSFLFLSACSHLGSEYAQKSHYQGNDLLDRLRNGFALPELDSRSTRAFIASYTRQGNHVPDLLSAAQPFLFYIVEEVEKRGMPSEIALLPAIESAYKPTAVSSSGARGLWQFIPSTGQHYGLHSNPWYEGRQDVIASTRAALDYLQELNTLFNGDWFLTLAAYNAGQGTVLRAMEQNRQHGRRTHYENLPLREETRHYVPKLIALKQIIAKPHKFSNRLPRIKNQPGFTQIDPGHPVDLQGFARQAQIPYTALQHLNSAYLRPTTPPAGPYYLLVPQDRREFAEQAVASLPEIELANLVTHRVSKGETLAAIARRYGISIESIYRANELVSNLIHPGQTLLLPTVNQVSDNTLHRVQKGDTLWSIARRYQVSVTDLLKWNQLQVNQILSLGQLLRVIAR